MSRVTRLHARLTPAPRLQTIPAPAGGARAQRARMSCVLDGEIVCLAPDGRSRFYDLMFRREWPHFIAFDVLAIDGEDLRGQPLLDRKRRLRAIMPRSESRLLY